MLRQLISREKLPVRQSSPTVPGSKNHEYSNASSPLAEDRRRTVLEKNQKSSWNEYEIRQEDIEQLVKVNQPNISLFVLVNGFLPLYNTAHNFTTSKE